MTGFCLGLAFALVAARIPAAAVTLAWTHSVERVRWEEDYRLTGHGMALTAARVRGSGAGMEPPAGAVLRDGWWHYRPALGVLDRITLARSDDTADYSLCWGGECTSLGALLGPPTRPGAPVDLFPCSSPRTARPVGPEP